MSGDGVLVAFEGIDGCGKSTQGAALVERLRASGPREVLAVREPGGTAFGERVREMLLHGGAIDPLTETLLYMASRAELYAGCVLPALARGAIVVLDRTHWSTAAYQGGGLGVDEALILATARAATRDREPDRILLLDVPVEAALGRLGATGAGPDRIEARGAAYFERVRAAYLRYARAAPGRFAVLDGTASEAEVARAVDEALRVVVG